MYHKIKPDMNQQDKGLEVRVGQVYRGVNTLTIRAGGSYQITHVNKTTCWVRLLQDGKPTNTIYKGVRFYLLGKLLVDVSLEEGEASNVLTT